MGSLLQFFDAAFSATPAVAMTAALAWGALSVLLSPCHLASIPLVVAYMGGGATLPGARRALFISAAFAAGILASIALVGLVTGLAGRMLGNVGPAGTWVLCGVFIAVGLNLLGVLPSPRFLSSRTAGDRRRGARGALLLGLVFGAALGPCTFAFLAPILAIALRAGTTSVAWGTLLVVLYGVGHAALISVAGASGEWVQRYLAWSAGSRGPAIVRRTAGVLVILSGIYFFVATT